MRIAIAGAGAVGRSIAAEMCAGGHEVLLIDRSARAIDVDALPGAEWLLADACELASLDSARLDEFDAAVAASGDDKVNLVFSLLAKTEFAVPRVIARVNDPRDEWLFTDAWGVDAAVSTPRLMVSLLEGPADGAPAGGDPDGAEAFSQASGETDLLELTLEEGSAFVGEQAGALMPRLPEGIVLVAVVRAGAVVAPFPTTELRAGDELVFLSSAPTVAELDDLLAPGGGA
ncbi:TrkA family potassium uptake protein [Nocardiopsis sp. RSe5-2]|uniref:TrkA family potassium uptake protein n=1 Tax=Nocardiopsis endophytica TaxID=3018445 RepID=A0ABT4U784_9ACTN|nr:TrkA family potassium uptake protein [Nocardiopsis endophytica]MDA2812803.1 TrkA family potassium uptake protein [Nocardiopsis endophytica]